MSVMTAPATIDEYLSALPEEQQKALQELRATIRTTAPDAEETISSRVPAFRYRGKYLVSFGAAKRHVSLLVMRGSALKELRDELKPFDVSSTVVRFTPDKPLPQRS